MYHNLTIFEFDRAYVFSGVVLGADWNFDIFSMTASSYSTAHFLCFSLFLFYILVNTCHRHVKVAANDEGTIFLSGSENIIDLDLLGKKNHYQK